MQPGPRHQPARSEQPTGDLALLLEAETRFADRLAAARREKERLIEEAHAAAESAAAALAASLPSELRALEERVRYELSRGRAQVEQSAARQIAAWRSLDEPRLLALAESVVLPRVLADLEITAAGPMEAHP